MRRFIALTLMVVMDLAAYAALLMIFISLITLGVFALVEPVVAVLVAFGLVALITWLADATMNYRANTRTVAFALSGVDPGAEGRDGSAPRGETAFRTMILILAIGAVLGWAIWWLRVSVDPVVITSIVFLFLTGGGLSIVFDLWGNRVKDEERSHAAEGTQADRIARRRARAEEIRRGRGKD